MFCRAVCTFNLLLRFYIVTFFCIIDHCTWRFFGIYITVSINDIKFILILGDLKQYNFFFFFFNNSISKKICFGHLRRQTITTFTIIFCDVSINMILMTCTYILMHFSIICLFNKLKINIYWFLGPFSAY